MVDDPGVLPQAAEVELYEAPRGGTVAAVEPRPLGEAVVAMGGGRQQLGDPIDPTVGFVVSARPGAKVARGEPIASIFARDPAGIETGMAALALGDPDRRGRVEAAAPPPEDHRQRRRGRLMGALFTAVLLVAVLLWLFAPARDRAEPADTEPVDEGDLAQAEREVRDLGVNHRPEDGFAGDDWGPGAGGRKPE